MPERSAGRRILSRLIAPHHPVLALLLLALVLYLPGVWLREPWNPDEPRYAQVTREMLSRSDFIMLSLNGEVYAEKPPLFFWLGALAGTLPGVPIEAGPRVVSALAAWLTLLLTFHLGRRLADAETGWLASLILATSSMFVVHAATGVIDCLLTLLVTAGIALGLQARQARSPVLWAGVYLLAALAVLAKGPVGFAIPMGVLLLTAWREDGVRNLRALHPVWGSFLVAAVVALWIGPAIARGGAEYAETILLKQNIGRAFQSWHHARPISYFVFALPIAFLPWSFLLPTALYGGWRAGGGAEGPRAARASRLTGLWFGFVLVLFSLISGKKTRYLLPLFPAASLLMALELRAVLAGVRGWSRTRIPLSLSGMVLAGSGLALILLSFAPVMPGSEAGLASRIGASDLPPAQAAGLLELVTAPGNVALVLPGLLILGLAGWGVALLGADRTTGLACILAACLVLIGWSQWVAVPAFDSIKSGKPLAEAALRAAGPSGEIALYRNTFAGIFNIQTRRDRIPVLRGLDRTSAFLKSHRGAVVIGGHSDIERLRGHDEDLEVIACHRIGASKVCAARLAD